MVEKPGLLFPSVEERARIDALLAEMLAGLDERIARGSVVPTLTKDRFRDELARFDFKFPLPVDEAMSWLVEQLEHGLVHVTHPRYFGLFNPAPTHASQCADRIAAALNPQLATWTTSPVGVDLERHVICAVAARCGFPRTASGHFTTGGSEANWYSRDLRIDGGEQGFCAEGCALLRWATHDVCVPGSSPRLDQDCPPVRHRARSCSYGRDGWNGQDVHWRVDRDHRG